MRIKESPEDFIVEEIAEHDLVSDGPYTLFSMTKRNLTTEEALAQVANAFRIPRRLLAIAGAKDKHAITTQFVTAKGEHRDVSLGDALSLRLVGKVREPLGLGTLIGNRFSITVRGLKEETFSALARIPNYYDEQRFSSHNADVGRLLIQKRYKEAAELVGSSVPEVRAMLAERPTDAVSALRAVPKHTLLMYVHAYQSALFNEALRKYIEAKDPSPIRIEGPVEILIPSGEIENAAIPIVGFASEIGEPFAAWYRELLSRDGIGQRDFVNRQIPFLTVEGTEREAFADVQGLVATARETDGDTRQRLEFSLGKGSYATMVVKCCYRSGILD